MPPVISWFITPWVCQLNAIWRGPHPASSKIFDFWRFKGDPRPFCRLPNRGRLFMVFGGELATNPGCSLFSLVLWDFCRVNPLITRDFCRVPPDVRYDMAFSSMLGRYARARVGAGDASAGACPWVRGTLLWARVRCCQVSSATMRNFKRTLHPCVVFLGNNH